MSASDTDRTHFESSSVDGSHPKNDDATKPTDRDLEKSTPQSQSDSPEDAAATGPPPIGSDAPDGGYRAWIVVFGAWCSSYCTWGWINGKQSKTHINEHEDLVANKFTIAVGVFQEYYQSTLLDDYSSSTVSWIPSLQFFFMMALVSSSQHGSTHHPILTISRDRSWVVCTTITVHGGLSSAVHSFTYSVS